MNSFNEKMMKRVFTLAKKGKGRVSPNPLVGAVIVKDDKIIGEGWHDYFGGPHAEVEAIKSAGDKNLKGSTLYVNLEPCNHWGKTPPCSLLIIEKKISKVVIGMQDPNRLVAGKGIQRLKEANINVEFGILEEEAKWLNRFFIKHITTGLPYVTAKSAQSIDGAIALRNDQSQWISSLESRRRAHKLRAEFDAVMIGKGTALTDNPCLTVRNVEGRNPIRVVMDSELSLPENLNIFNTSEARTIICFSELANSKRAKILKKKGIDTIPVKVNSIGKMDLLDALSKLYSIYNIGSILLEGGAKLSSSFLEDSLIDELHFFIAPMIIGDGLRPFKDYIIDDLSLAKKFKIKEIHKSGSDIEIIAAK